MEMTLKARTAYGLGGPEFYTEVVEIPDTPEWIDFAKRQFSVKYGADLDHIEVLMHGADYGQSMAHQ